MAAGCRLEEVTAALGGSAYGPLLTILSKTSPTLEKARAEYRQQSF